MNGWSVYYSDGMEKYKALPTHVATRWQTEGLGTVHSSGMSQWEAEEMAEELNNE